MRKTLQTHDRVVSADNAFQRGGVEQTHQHRFGVELQKGRGLLIGSGNTGDVVPSFHQTSDYPVTYHTCGASHEDFHCKLSHC